MGTHSLTELISLLYWLLAERLQWPTCPAAPASPCTPTYKQYSHLHPHPTPAPTPTLPPHPHTYTPHTHTPTLAPYTWTHTPTPTPPVRLGEKQAGFTGPTHNDRLLQTSLGLLAVRLGEKQAGFSGERAASLRSDGLLCNSAPQSMCTSDGLLL